MTSKEVLIGKAKKFKQFKKDGIHRIEYVVVPGFEGYKVYDDRGFTVLSITNYEIMRGGFYAKKQLWKRKQKDSKEKSR